MAGGYPMQVIGMTTVEEKDDLLLRFDELPCPKYDQKIHNSVGTTAC